MVNVKCSVCGTTLRWEDSRAGQVGPCDQCGATVRAPGKAAGPQSQGSDTARALEEAMRAMEEKPIKPRRASATTAQAFALGTSKPVPAASTPTPVRANTGNAKGKISARQIKIVVASVAALILLAVAYVAWTPSGWEVEHRDQVRSIKIEADRLADEGKVVEAYQKYQQIVLMTTGQQLKGSETRRLVEQARASRDQLREKNRDVIDKARSAGAD